MAEHTTKPRGVVEVNMETMEFTYDVSQMDRAQIWRCAVALAATKAYKTFPTLTKVIEKAVSLVLADAVEDMGDHTALVASQQAPGVAYKVDKRTCECPHFPHAHEGWCKHRMAFALVRRAVQYAKEFEGKMTLTLAPALMAGFDEDEASVPVASVPAVAESPAVVEDAPVVEDDPVSQEEEPQTMEEEPVIVEETAETCPVTIERTVPAQFVVSISGVPAVQYKGLLHLATIDGLVSMAEEPVHIEAELMIVKATATFADGRVFIALGDATPKNVTPRIAPHFRRMAATRAKARALRDALNIGMVTAEELTGD